APWMSSGLTDNNAFTTTLMLRAYGFLEQEGLFDGDSPKVSSKKKGLVREWDLNLGMKDALRLADRLKKHSDTASEFLWFSLSDDVRNLIAEVSKGGTKSQKWLKAALALDLRRIIQSGWIYE